MKSNYMIIPFLAVLLLIGAWASPCLAEGPIMEVGGVVLSAPEGFAIRTSEFPISLEEKMVFVLVEDNKDRALPTQVEAAARSGGFPYIRSGEIVVMAYWISRQVLGMAIEGWKLLWVNGDKLYNGTIAGVEKGLRPGLSSEGGRVKIVLVPKGTQP